MKKMCVLIGWLGLSAAAFGQEADPGFHLVGIGSVSIPVSGMKMTNLVFPAEVSSAVKVSKDVQMQRPKGVQNVIELKALRRDFPPTNLSVYGRDGHPYSFVLHFVDDTSVLNFQVVRGGAVTQGSGSPEGPTIIFAGLPVDGVTLDSDGVALSERRPFLHKSVSVSGLRLRLNSLDYIIPAAAPSAPLPASTGATAAACPLPVTFDSIAPPPEGNTLIIWFVIEGTQK